MLTTNKRTTDVSVQYKHVCVCVGRGGEGRGGANDFCFDFTFFFFLVWAFAKVVVPLCMSKEPVVVVSAAWFSGVAYYP